MKPLPDNLPGSSAGSTSSDEAIAILEPRYRLLLPEVAQTCIVQVGVGGTGSWLAAALARIVYHARQKGEVVKLILVDPDIVGESNIGRQNCKLFGIKWVYLHYCRLNQYGGDKTNEYRSRLEQVSPGE
jgi:tRNA A37 threonylcarbamoyladenosine dehydratase